MKRSVRCAIMRGGTSKAVVFAEQDLPPDAGSRDRLILAAFGSPDPRQVDGLGGADPLTSKVAIVSRSSCTGADVDYTFGQVGIGSSVVNYAFSCGNTAAAVALYAAEERLVGTNGGAGLVRVHCTNNGKRISAQVATDATPSGTKVRLEFHEPTGGDTGALLPSGAAVDEIRTANGRPVRFSLVDCGNTYAIFPAATWSLTGCESPSELDCNHAFRREIEALRAAIAARYLAGDPRKGQPGRANTGLKIAIVGRPAIDAGQPPGAAEGEAADVVARIINPECVHKTFAVTGAMNLAAAAGVPGSVVAELLDRRLAGNREVFRIRHPRGLIAPEVVFGYGSDRSGIQSILIDRTARRIMDGLVHVPAEAVVAHPPCRDWIMGGLVQVPTEAEERVL